MKINISTQTLPPVVVEIRGVSYPVKPIARAQWRMLRDIQKRVSDGDSEAIFDQIPVLLDLPKEVEDALEYREVVYLVQRISLSMYAPFTGIDGEEKKV